MANIAGCKAKVLFDTGASVNAISEEFCQRYGICVDCNPESIAVKTVSEAPESTVIGQCKLKLRLQDFTSTVTFLVLRMHMEYDVLLGDPWLTAVNAQMFYDNKLGCTAINVQTTLKLPNKAVKPLPKKATHPPGSAIRVSALQLKRLCKANSSACYSVVVCCQA